MSIGEWSAVVGAAAAVAFVGVFAALASAVKRLLAEVLLTVFDLRASLVPLLEDAHGTIDHANHALAKTDGLLDTAQSIGGTVESASKLGYKLVSNPLIKVMAAGSGVARGARSLKGLRGRKG